MKAWRVVLSILFLNCGFQAQAQEQQDSIVINKIAEDALLQSTAYDNLRILCKQIGHRLSGSPQKARANEWGVEILKAAGADSVWLQPVMVPVWERGFESMQVRTQKGTWKTLKMISLGNSEGTKGKELKAPIIVFQTLDDLKSAPEENVKGKVVFLNAVFPQKYIKTFEAYGASFMNRYSGPNLASEKGAIAFVMRSLSTGVDDAPHTGVMSYKTGLKKIPALALGNASADLLNELCKQQAMQAKIVSNCGMNGAIMDYNVIGELKGITDNIITVGGHLDSWDVGEGAHDDGAGCVQSVEVLRLLKKQNIPLKNTLRIVLFANEENGAKGGVAYADSALSKNEKHIFALESDAGGFSPRGFGLVMPEQQKAVVRSWKDLLLPLGIYDFSQEEGGVDISPLGKKLKTPLSGLLPDSQRYFDIHHNENDVFELINKRELELGAAAMAAMVYLVDKYF